MFKSEPLRLFQGIDLEGCMELIRDIDSSIPEEGSEGDGGPEAVEKVGSVSSRCSLAVTDLFQDLTGPSSRDDINYISLPNRLMYLLSLFECEQMDSGEVLEILEDRLNILKALWVIPIIFVLLIMNEYLSFGYQLPIAVSVVSFLAWLWYRRKMARYEDLNDRQLAYGQHTLALYRNIKGKDPQEIKTLLEKDHGKIAYGAVIALSSIIDNEPLSTPEEGPYSCIELGHAILKRISASNDYLEYLDSYPALLKLHEKPKAG